MVLTSAEKVRRYRERQKKKAEASERERAPSIYLEAYSDYQRQEQLPSFANHAVQLGTDWWNFDSDNGINPLSLDGVDEDDLGRAKNSLGKAELVIDVLLDAVSHLTNNVSRYKRAQIDARIAELLSGDLSDAEANKMAFSEANRLGRMRDQLDKQVRWTFPQWKVTGE